MSEDQVETLKRDIQKILSYLHNDEDAGKKGLVADFADHKQKVNDFIVKYESDQAVKKAKISTWGMVGGGVVAFILWVGKLVTGWFVEHIK